MNLSTHYLGLTLDHPLIVGASPLTASIDDVRRCEDHGAAAIVLPSLFEEQIIQEQIFTTHAFEHPSDAIAEATSFFVEPPGLTLGSEKYLAHLSEAAEAVNIPVFASLNGITPGGWVEYARLMKSAGASAIELNLFNARIDPARSAEAVERETLELVRQVVECLQIPVALKLSPFYTALPNLANAMWEVGAQGLVLFNRLYQPDIEPETLQIRRDHIADPTELSLRLHWTGVLFERFHGSLAVTGGVHTGRDVIKATMAGAHAVQMVSALFLHGLEHLKTVRHEIEAWLRTYEYDSLEQMRGSLSLARCPNPEVYYRDNYVQLLRSWPEIPHTNNQPHRESPLNPGSGQGTYPD